MRKKPAPPAFTDPAPAKAPAKRAARPQGPRVNLTLTPELDALLDRFARVSGLGKASIVTQWMTMALPQLEEMVKALELAAAKNLDAFTVIERAMREVGSEAAQLELDMKNARRRAARRRGAA